MNIFDKIRGLKIFRLFMPKNRCEVHYINGSETLPAPLSKAQEEETFKLLEIDGEQARKLLITHNLRLVVYIAKKFESTGIGIEDLVSIGTIGLIKAVKTFCPNKNIKLATYASRCIENEILMHLRRTSKTKLEVSIDEPLNVDWDGNEILMFLRKSSQYKNEISIDEPLNIDWDGNELLLSDILGTEEDTVNGGIENEAEKTVLLEAVERLPERERSIMKMRFGLTDGKEKTQKEVADIIGISQSYISRLEKRIIKKLRRELEKVIT